MMRLVFLLLGTIAGSAAFAQGGGGVKNGGTAIQCPKDGGRVQMLEAYEVQAMSGTLSNIEDRAEFFKAVFTTLEKAGTAQAQKLTIDLQRMLIIHGSIDTWRATAYRTPTILAEDSWNSKNVDHVEWVSGIVYLKNGCRILPMSYLGIWDSKPRLVRSNIGLLNAFNRNVLELHEALYDIFVGLSPPTVLNVLPTRHLGRSLLNTSLPVEALNRVILDFYDATHPPKFSLPLDLRHRLIPNLPY